MLPTVRMLYIHYQSPYTPRRVCVLEKESLLPTVYGINLTFPVVYSLYSLHNVTLHGQYSTMSHCMVSIVQCHTAWSV